MIGPFQFEDGGRSYSCTVEERRTAPMGKWWWFEVSGDGQRYAPFEAESKDHKRPEQRLTGIGHAAYSRSERDLACRKQKA